MTDFFVLPGTRVPLSGSTDMPRHTPGPTTPLGTPPQPDGGVVQVVDAEWARRAGVARELAGELGEARTTLVRVAMKNHYGEGAAEGQEFHARVKSFISEFTAQITEHIQALDALAAQCDLANTQLHRADEDNAGAIQA